MQLDRTRITIRERGLLDILDLGLRVMWVYAGPLLGAAALGMAPLLLLNMWLLADLIPDPELYDLTEYFDREEYSSNIIRYLFTLLLLIAWQIPLATAPLTLYLGTAVFEEKPNFRGLWKTYWEMFPQFLLSRVIQRGLWLVIPVLILLADVEPGVFVLAMLLLPVPFLVRPYASEVILLERNPLVSKSPDTVTTARRNRMLHARSFAELFGRWTMVLAVSVVWTLALWFSLEWLVELLFGHAPAEWYLYGWILQAVVWFVVGYAAVVRFLSYLDLRIRREGWEVELRMRAEGNRIARQLT